MKRALSITHKQAFKSDHVIFDRDNQHHDLQDFSFTFIELEKFNKTISELSNIVDKWTYFFKHAEETSKEELDQLVGGDIISPVFLRINFKCKKQVYVG